VLGLLIKQIKKGLLLSLIFTDLKKVSLANSAIKLLAHPVHHKATEASRNTDQCQCGSILT